MVRIALHTPRSRMGNRKRFVIEFEGSGGVNKVYDDSAAGNMRNTSLEITVAPKELKDLLHYAKWNGKLVYA